MSPAEGPEASKAMRSAAFRERARQEADRYGPDPWIFVRELLQNSRDAGASAVSFTVDDRDGLEQVRCVDDGEGMSFVHARKYLFALYASSKESSSNQAGKFGVGFWSVLRFEPEQITIRCRTRSGESWGLQLDGALENAQSIAGLNEPGTEITVVRRGGDGRLEHRVYDAVWQSARYLHRRGDVNAALPITVNGRPANAAFALDAPSSSFRRGAVRGVVGLGPAPRVELFSRGLRLRAAASLDDLVAPTGRHSSRMRVQFPELPGGMAPQALLESDELQVMLSRSDARDNRALTRLVKLAQKELERLIEQQLSQVRPRRWWRRAWDFIVERLRDSLALRTLLGAVLGAGLALLIGWVLWGPSLATQTVSPEITLEPSPPATARLPQPRPYQDLGARYRGPRVDVLEPGSAEPIELRYLPASQRLHFAALSFAELAEDGSPAVRPPSKLRDYRGGVSCDRNCVEVELPVQGPGVVRLPVPTGHRLVSGSLHIDDSLVPATMTDDEHPAIHLPDTASVMLSYRTVAAPDPRTRRQPLLSAALPAELRSLALSIRPTMVEDRVKTLVDEVRERVHYDRTPRVAEQHTQAVEQGIGFVERTLKIGAGDCDVQNGLLVALLHAANVEARLAVGYLGSEGRVFPWLHAWVEYRDASGAWRVADASEGSNAAFPPTAFPTPTATPPPSASQLAPAPSTKVAKPTASPEVVDAQPEQDRPALQDEPQAATAVPATTATDTDTDTDTDTGVVAMLQRLDNTYPWFLRGLPFVFLGVVIWSLFGPRTRRAVKLDDAPDLSRLLRGVLQQPAAFAQMTALFTRAIVPCLKGTAISINRARELAARGLLYASAQRPPLAMRALKAKAVVLDATTPEGKTVADSLGAIDLDRWASWLSHAQTNALTRTLDAELARAGEDWSVRVAEQLPNAVTVLDLGKLGAKVPGFRGSRLVLLDPHTPVMKRARELEGQGPRLAALLLLDMLAERLDLEAPRRARLLGDAARDALLEGFGR